MALDDKFQEIRTNNINNSIKSKLQEIIQPKQLVGDIFSIGYESAKVIIHDTYRQEVGGIPSLSFLIATRLNPYSEQEIDLKEEDTSFILLRVMNSANLPQDQEAERIRVETAQRVSGENKHWDSVGVMDYKTKNYLSYSGLECRIIGTFFFEEENNELMMKFGSDISNYYPNRGLKVYKPVGEALGKIVNYCDPQTLAAHFENFNSNAKVKLGNVRYASTNRKYQNVDNVPVYIYPADLLAQKSALFGMTRTGKSNTTKIIAKSVYELRFPLDTINQPLRVGQIIFDPNGEYANENAQDADSQNNPNALKNVWKKNKSLFDKVTSLQSLSNQMDLSTSENAQRNSEISDEIKNLIRNEVVTYGILPHAFDPYRKLMKMNFHDWRYLQIGKEIIDFALIDQNAQYFKNFKQVTFNEPLDKDYANEQEFNSQLTRYKRRVLVYRTLLSKAGFAPDNNPDLKNLFSKELRNLMTNYSEKKFTNKVGAINQAGLVLSQDNVSWGALATAFEGLFYFLSTPVYNQFNLDYIAGKTTDSDDEEEDSTGEGWADSDLESLLEMFKYSKAINLISGINVQHTTDVNSDYVSDIYDDLVKGKLVIIDQSSGEYELNKASAERIMEKIFRENQKVFRNAERPKDILVYAEEAHNLLPAGNDLDTSNIWVKTAKEGAKYRIGMVYATQEVSSIQKNILKNTSNWFISHLNNTDETKELCKYYDFIDFEPSIRRAQDKGFLRVKTLSNLFVVPVQVEKFQINT